MPTNSGGVAASYARNYWLDVSASFPDPFATENNKAGIRFMPNGFSSLPTTSSIVADMITKERSINVEDEPIARFTKTSLTFPKNTAYQGTVAGITKAMVGLPNVNDTSDLDKPFQQLHKQH